MCLGPSGDRREGGKFISQPFRHLENASEPWPQPRLSPQNKAFQSRKINAMPICVISSGGPKKGETFHREIKGRFRKRVVLANVPSFRVFVPGEHANVPSFRFSFRWQPRNLKGGHLKMGFRTRIRTRHVDFALKWALDTASLIFLGKFLGESLDSDSAV